MGAHIVDGEFQSDKYPTTPEEYGDGAEWHPFSPPGGADRVTSQLTTFEDGGKPGETTRPHPQGSVGGGHVRQGATAEGAGPDVGNVAESQLGPTPDRVEHPPSSSFVAGRSTPARFGDCAVLVDPRGKQWKYSEPADVWNLVDGHLGPGSISLTSARSFQKLVADFGPLSPLAMDRDE